MSDGHGMVLTRTMMQWVMVKAQGLQEPWCSEWLKHGAYKNHDAVMSLHDAYKNHDAVSNGQGMVLTWTMVQWVMVKVYCKVAVLNTHN